MYYLNKNWFYKAWDFVPESLRATVYQQVVERKGETSDQQFTHETYPLPLSPTASDSDTPPEVRERNQRYEEKKKEVMAIFRRGYEQSKKTKTSLTPTWQEKRRKLRNDIKKS